MCLHPTVQGSVLSRNDNSPSLWPLILMIHAVAAKPAAPEWFHEAGDIL